MSTAISRPTSSPNFYSLSRDGDSGTVLTKSAARASTNSFLSVVATWGQRNRHVLTVTIIAPKFVFAVARWGQRNSSPPDSSSGTGSPCFYSLSRDGDSGTLPRLPRQRLTPFLFAVARWGQRNAPGKRAQLRDWFLFAVARWGQRNCAFAVQKEPMWKVSIRCREMGTAERARQASPAEGLVSIRCREMGTAEPPQDRDRQQRMS